MGYAVVDELSRCGWGHAAVSWGNTAGSEVCSCE